MKWVIHIGIFLLPTITFGQRVNSFIGYIFEYRSLYENEYLTTNSIEFRPSVYFQNERTKIGLNIQAGIGQINNSYTTDYFNMIHVGIYGGHSVIKKENQILSLGLDVNIGPYLFSRSYTKGPDAVYPYSYSSKSTVYFRIPISYEHRIGERLFWYFTLYPPSFAWNALPSWNNVGLSTGLVIKSRKN